MRDRDERLAGGRPLSANANLTALSPSSRKNALGARRNVKLRLRRVAERLLVAAARQDHQRVLLDNQKEDVTL